MEETKMPAAKGGCDAYTGHSSNAAKRELKKFAFHLLGSKNHPGTGPPNTAVISFYVLFNPSFLTFFFFPPTSLISTNLIH